MNPENNSKEVKGRFLPGKASLAGAALLSCLMTVASAASFCTYDLPGSVLAFIAGSALLSFFLIFVRHPLAVVVPAASAAVSILLGCDVLASSAVACGVTVFAAVYTICHLRLLESFRQFLVTTLLYSVAGGGLFCLIIRSIYGSVGEGIVAFGGKIMSYASVLADMAAKQEGIDYDTAFAMFSVLLENAHIYLPAIIASIGVVCAWLTRGIFSLYTRVAGVPSLFGGRQSSPPRLLAILFIIVSLFGTFLAFLPGGAFYAVSNIRSIVAAMFFGEGVRLIFAPAKKRGGRRIPPAFVMGLLVLVFFFPVIIPLMLPYYGAFCVLRDSKGQKNRKI